MKRLWASFKSHPYITNVVGYTTLFATADLIQQSMLGGRQVHTGLDKEPTLDRAITEEKEHEGKATSEERGVIPEMDSIKQMELFPKMAKKDTESPGSEQGSAQTNDTGKTGQGKWSDIDWSQTARVALVGFCFHANFNYNWLKGLERMWPGGGAKRVAGKVFLDQLIAAPATISVFYIGLSVLEGRQDPFEDWREKFWTSYKTGVIYWSTMQAVNFSLVPPVARTVFVGGVALVWTVFLCHLRQQRDVTRTDALND